MHNTRLNSQKIVLPTWILWRVLRGFQLNHSKATTILTCSLVLLALAIVQAPPTPSSYQQVDLDQAWLISLGALLQRGQISGRDFYFTYGPLAQFLSWIGVVIRGSGLVTDAFPIILLCYETTIIVLLAILLALIRRITWKHALFIYLVLTLLQIPFFYAAFRPLLVMVCASLLGYTLSTASRRKRLALAASVGALCFVAQLFTAELGVYALLGTGCVLLFCGIVTRFARLLQRSDLWPARAYAEIFGVVVGVFTFGNLVISILFKLFSASYANLFDYQKYILEVMRGYNNTMGGISWQLSSVASLGLGLVAVYVVGYMMMAIRRLKSSDAFLLLCLTTFGLIQLKGLVTRSDAGHIMLALMPLVIVFLLIAQDWLTNRVHIAWAGLLVVLLTVWPITTLTPLKQMQAGLQGQISLRTRIQRVFTSPATPQSFLPPDLLSDAGDRSTPRLTFPYENHMGLALGHNLVVPVLQGYSAHTQLLQKFYVDRLETQGNNLEILYGLDSVVSDPVDGVQHVTRLPIIFDYLYRNFELKSFHRYGSGYYLLERRQTPVTINATNLNFTTRDLGSANLTLNLNQPASCSLVRMAITIGYPVTSLLGRPAGLTMRFTSQDTEIQRSNLVAIESGSVFTTYVSLTDANMMYTVFGSAGSQVKTWDSLQIAPRETDSLSVLPNRVDIHRLECIDLATPPPTMTGSDLVFNIADGSLWKPHNMIQVNPTDNANSAWVVAGDDPILEYRPALNACLDDYSHIFVRIAIPSGVPTPQVLQVFYRVDKEPGFEETHRATVAVVADGQMHDYYFDIRWSDPPMHSRLAGIRLDPVASALANGQNEVHIADFRLIRRSGRQLDPTQCTQQ